MSAINSNNVSNTLCIHDTCTQAYLNFGEVKNLQGELQDALMNFKDVHEFVVASSDVNSFALYRIQDGKAKALRGLGMIKEAEELETRNAVMNETLEWDRAEIES